MNRYFVLIVLICLAGAGCRVNPRAEREIALLRAEILDLEDEYYALKSKCAAAGVDTSGGYVGGGGFEYCEDCGPTDQYIFDTPTGSGVAPQTAPTVIDSDIDPEIIEPDASLDDLSFTDQIRDASKESAARASSASFVNQPLYDRGDSSEIYSLLINREISRGEDIDGEPGDEGLTLLIQPVDRSGNIRKIAGNVTIRLVEKVENANSRQIGNWQFSPIELRNFFVNDEFAQQGILLHLPWGNTLPESEKLTVFVRFGTSDNRNVDASAQLNIIPPTKDYSPKESLIASWIENDSRWFNISATVSDNRPISSSRNAKSLNRTSAPKWRPVR